MTELKIYQVDAFADKVFMGNPAAVVPLTEWLPQSIMQKIAMENNLAETAFYVPKDEHYEIRWFTPTYEIDLCGHATLATAYIIYTIDKYAGDTILFQSHLSGELRAFREEDYFGIDLPSRPPVNVPVPTDAEEALGFNPLAAFKARDLILLIENEDQIKNLTPNKEIMKKWDALLVVPTCVGKKVDFVSRVFDPHDDIIEDPVTGSAHCSLVPYWKDVLSKYKLKAAQLSPRSGELLCELKGERVLLKGKVVKYLEGIIQF